MWFDGFKMATAAAAAVAIVYFKSNFIKEDSVIIIIIINEYYIANEFNQQQFTQWLFNLKTNYVNCICEKLGTHKKLIC